MHKVSLPNLKQKAARGGFLGKYFLLLLKCHRAAATKFKSESGARDGVRPHLGEGGGKVGLL